MPATAYLDPDSYTARRLSHASPEHLYITSRRCFIGPIPEGWLKSHRRDWYRHHLGLNYSSRSATFSTDPGVSQTQRVSGLGEPSSSAVYRQSFRQPEDIRHGEQDDAGTREQGNRSEVVGDVQLSRASQPDSEVTQVDRGVVEDDAILEGARPLDGDTPRMSSEVHPTEGRADDATSQRSPSEPGHARSHEDLSPQSTRRLSKDNGELEEPPLNSTAAGTIDPQSSGITSVADSQMGPGNGGCDVGASHASTKSLLEHMNPPSPAQVASTGEPVRTDSESRPSRMLQHTTPLGRQYRGAIRNNTDARTRGSQLVHFAVPDSSRRADFLYRAKATQMNLQRSATSLIRGKGRDGLVMKMEKMVVRVDVTAEKQLPADYDENGSQGIISRTTEKWREFMVVCRESKDEETEFVLQMYKTRVIPAIQDGKANKRVKHEIILNKQSSHVNLYSSLDKSIVVWVPYHRGTKIYILRPKSSADAVEWYTFLRNILGWHRAQELTINVPDLGVSLRLQNPFKDLEAMSDATESGELDEDAVQKAINQEQAIASDIVQRCLDMLRKNHEWDGIVKMWAVNGRIGLAWKRYDRLEWIHGVNESKMYGTIAMMKSHELELRPKSHAPTTTRDRRGKRLTEPAPVEGFLIRLTSQKGTHQKMGKLFFKRLYFSTHDQYLVFSRPAKASPPPPPKLPVSTDSDVPDAHTLAENVPLIYAVNPYPIKDGKISWLADSQHPQTDIRQRDRDGHDEAERNFNVVLESDGFIDLTQVQKVRDIQRGATPADDNIQEGTDVDFDEDVVDSATDDGATQELDDDRTFELVLKNGLVIRLQTYNKVTKVEWKRRLRALIRYWHYRTKSEMELFRSVRKQNLSELKIDEDAEAIMGQFAKKWEVTQTYASPELYHMCGISSCRTIHLSGRLYRKPRLHSSFVLTSCILVAGHLLLFSPTMRSRTGRDIPTIHHERQRALDLDLSQCYLYSGLLTENELLYTNKTFDSNRPGRSGLHRWYADDAWKVSDEDVMCTFVLWYQRRKDWLRVPGSSAVNAIAAMTSNSLGHEEPVASSKLADTSRRRNDSDAAEREGGSHGTRARLKRVSQLGVKGRSIVFKARSRAERDRWVLALSTEIDRLAGAEAVRLTTGGDGKG